MEALRDSERSMPREPLAESLAAARKNGYARLVYPSGDISVAVAVGAPPVAGIALSGKFPEEHVPELVARLRRAAGQIEEDMRHPVKRR